MLGCAADAGLSAAIVRVWKSAARYEPTAKFTTWLMTITRNLVFNEMRRRRRTHLIPMETDQDDAGQHQFADAEAPAPSERLIDAELQEAIDAAIAGLPENQRVARYCAVTKECLTRKLRCSTPAFSGGRHHFSRPFRAKGEPQGIFVTNCRLSVRASFPTVRAIWVVFEKSAPPPATRLRWRI